ncbi:MAG: hypothetical protein K2Y51_03635 [Gammaproteobacteria bacterium]|nr:hypothetical protein [Gammaproteobacteria bacterium]
MTKCKGPGMVLLAGGLLLSAVGAQAGGKIAIDDTKWISIGAGARGSFSTIEDQAGNGDWSSDFNADNARIYVNGQVNQYVKFELNTECIFCGNSALEEFHLLDAIAKFEWNQYFNVWAGRLLVPAERQELNGPFYSTTYDAYRTPFESSDFSTTFGTGGAGVYGRDHGVNVFGAAGPGGALQYVFGVFNGLESAAGFGPNQDDNLLYAGRVAYNFLSVEKNPGYYTSGTYYGTGGDILTLGIVAQYQEDGSGSFLNPGDHLNVSVDLLFEKILPNKGVFTFNGEYKNFNSDYDSAAFADPDCFCTFDGQSYSVAALYMFPDQVFVGKVQPYVRWTDIMADDSADRDEFEAGINYIIDGHNARASLFYQHGDIITKGLNYSPTAAGAEVDAIRLAVQLQI